MYSVPQKLPANYILLCTPYNVKVARGLYQGSMDTGYALYDPSPPNHTTFAYNHSARSAHYSMCPFQVGHPIICGLNACTPLHQLLSKMQECY